METEAKQLPRILVIDDNPNIHRDFELVFADESRNHELEADERRVFGNEASPAAASHDYDIDHALSGLEGVEKVSQAIREKRPFQMAFVDIRMPGIDGVETIKRMWQVDPRIQAVICTAYADYSQEDLTQLLGHTDKLLLLKKPFDSIEVTQLARTLTEKWFLARQAALKMEEMELLVARRTQKLLELQRQESKKLHALDQSKLRQLAALGKELGASLNLALKSAGNDHRLQRLQQLADQLQDFDKLETGVAPASDEAEISTSSAEDWESTESKLPLLLIVGDDDEVCVQIGREFEPAYRIIKTGNDRQALEKARDIVPDLVILDLTISEPKGMEFCRQLKAASLTNHIPIIALATDTSEKFQTKALEAGVEECVVKPPNLSLLKSRVESLLESRRRSHERIPLTAILQPRDIVASKEDAQFLQRIINVIEQHLSDFEFDVDELARKVAVSRRQLFRKLKAVMDTTPKALIRSIRLKRAAQLLEESQMTVTEITYAVGFSDVKHFRNLFREQFGVLPGQYTKRSFLQDTSE